MIGVAARQIPEPGAVTLDHLAHWAPDIDAASARMEQLGFTLTPYSRQFLPPAPGAEPAPAGTGNRCIMLEEGYIEILGVEKDADTPNAASLRQGMQRYVGVHIVAFGAADADRVAAGLTTRGLEPLPTVHLQRHIGTETGEGLARFSVVRLAPGVMEEGRIQYCVHHTPELLWQQRWLQHPNGAIGLAHVVTLVKKPAEVAKRYAKFLGRKGRRILGSDTIFLMDRPPQSFWLMKNAPGFGTPLTLPCIMSYMINVRDIEETWRCLNRANVGAERRLHDIISVAGGPALGGTITFQQWPPKETTPSPA